MIQVIILGAHQKIKNPTHQGLIEIMHEGAKGDIPTLRSRDINLVAKYVNEVNEVLKCIPVRNLSELKYVARASALLVCEKVGVKTDHTINKKEPFWKRRIEKDIAILRKDLSRIDDWFEGRWKNGSTKLKCEMKKKYKIKAKGFNTVIEGLKQCISGKALKLKHYKPRVKQYRQNRTFMNNEKALYEELDGKMRQEQVMSDSEESIKFWSELWDNPVGHNRNAEWIMTVEKELECVTQQGNINMTKKDVSIHLRKISNWKAPGPDGLHGFWLKKLASLHQAIVKHLDDCIKTGNVPSWMVESRTVLIQKDARDGNAVGNYRPIACLNLLWKLLAGIINEKVYGHLNKQKLLTEEQKVCR